MKKITLLMIALCVAFTSAVQAQTVNFTKTAPTLNAEKDEKVYTGSAKQIDNWINPDSPVAGFSAEFWYAYDNDNLYVYITSVVAEKADNDEIVMMVSIDQDTLQYGWTGANLTANGTVFSKILLGEQGNANWSAPEGVETTIRNSYTWIWNNTTEGYDAEVRIPWRNLTTNDSILDAFKAMNVKRIWFDVGFKLAGDNTKFVAHNDGQNRFHEQKRFSSRPRLEWEHRNHITIPRTANPPVYTSLLKEPGNYSVEAYEMDSWIMGATPVADVSGQFWISYDDTNLYIFTEIVTPTRDNLDELGVTVVLEEEEFGGSWEPYPFSEAHAANGLLFSKAELGSDHEVVGLAPQTDRTIRNMKWYYEHSVDGYEIEVVVPWASVTTNNDILDNFFERGTFFFDLGVKLAGANDKYFAWSNNDNEAYRRTFTAGIATLGPVIGTNVRNEATAAEFSIYPNPARDILFISSKANAGVAEVYDLLGKRVLVSNLETGSVDVSSLRDGIYMVRVNFDNGQSAVKKFVKSQF